MKIPSAPYSDSAGHEEDGRGETAFGSPLSSRPHRTAPADSLPPGPLRSCATGDPTEVAGIGETGRVVTLTAVRGDITKQHVDAIVNAANNRMRGGGGVDGAIHRGAGPALLRDCIARFPDGLATGDAGWTTAGDLSASWVIHTVGPNYSAGERDRSLLESCYRRALEVADELGARSVAFPLISAGVYGWPHADAISAAVDTIAETPTRVLDVRLMAFDDAMHLQMLPVVLRRFPADR